MKNLNAKILMGNASFLTPFLETEKNFSKSCLISAIGLTKYTICGKVHWVTFDLVDHKILIEQLSAYKFSSSSLKWFKYYIESRQQTVQSD